MLGELLEIKSLLVAKIKNDEVRFDRIDGRFDLVEDRLTLVEDRLALVDERFINIDTRFEDMDKKFTLVDERFVAMHKELNSMNNAIAGLGVRFEKQIDYMQAIAEQFTGLAAKVETNRKNIEAMTLA